MEIEPESLTNPPSPESAPPAECPFPPPNLNSLEANNTVSQMQTETDARWKWFGITVDFLEAKAEWLRAPRKLHGSSVRFFELAGTLVSHSKYDYPLSSLAFFQGVIGLERALKLHYQTEEKSLAALMATALEDSLLRDSLFSTVAPFSKEFSQQIKARSSTHSETLVALVPKLRNQFFHGTYLLAPDYLDLTLQMREIADAIKT